MNKSGPKGNLRRTQFSSCDSSRVVDAFVTFLRLDLCDETRYSAAFVSNRTNIQQQLKGLPAEEQVLLERTVNLMTLRNKYEKKMVLCTGGIVVLLSNEEALVVAGVPGENSRYFRVMQRQSCSALPSSS